jgi:two-component system, NtrC family, nitrogen regulation sensor histidine kinase NtrY
VLSLLEQSREDQKRLAHAEPANERLYKRRFESIQGLLASLRILELNRREIVARYETALLVLVGAVAAAGTAAWAVRQGRQEARLARLQAALAELAAGRTDLALGERRRDLVGRIAAMVEETSRAMARDRRRLASLENLSAWQEAARRHAHEMRTPLTAARLELVRLRGELAKEGSEASAAVRAADSVLQDLDRLGRFTQGFASFARLPRPRPVRQDLTGLVAEFVEVFGTAWPGLELRFAHEESCDIAIDREMLRQVLVNLCDNSALALGGRPGSIVFSLVESPAAVCLEVTDDGPGVPPEVRPRLFEPYTTTRGIGEGMGLGLAISRKILLDHGGDLELAATVPGGTTFRLVFPREGIEEKAAEIGDRAAGIGDRAAGAGEGAA